MSWLAKLKKDIATTCLTDFIINTVRDNLLFADEDDCWVQGLVTDGAAPTISNEGQEAGSISVTGGTGANGNGRIYTLSWPTPHPKGANFHADISPWDDTVGDSAIPEILATTATSITYQLTNGDDGASEDENDFYAHNIKIFGTNQTFVTGI